MSPERPSDADGTPDVIGSLLRLRMVCGPPRPGLRAQLDRFEILELLGCGGMGLVLLARDTRDDSRVALKMLKPELLHDARARHQFEVEVRHLEELDHPGILRVLEFANRDAGPYFVMPYLAGGSLAQRIERDAPLGREFILETAARVADALRHAHARGLIHRDLKPSNILLSGDGAVVVSDFGLARTIVNDSLLDLHGNDCQGTAPYLSPAVARGEAEDTRRDIYALGAVLYEMLTGRPPYRGENSAAVLEQIKAGPPPPILELNPQADHGLARIAERAMARSLRDRYAEMSDVQRDLERAAGGEPIRRARAAPRGRLRLALPALGAAVALAGAWWLGRWSAQPPVHTISFFSEPFAMPEAARPIQSEDGFAPVPELQVRVRVPAGTWDAVIWLEPAGTQSALHLEHASGRVIDQGVVLLAIERARPGAAECDWQRVQQVGPVARGPISLPHELPTDRTLTRGEHVYRLSVQTRNSLLVMRNVRLCVELHRTQQGSVPQ